MTTIAESVEELDSAWLSEALGGVAAADDEAVRDGWLARWKG